MDALILKYYIFKKLIEKLPNVIKANLQYTDNELVNYVSFNTSPLFINKDKYELYDNFKSDKYKDFIIEVIINLSIKNDYQKLLFTYGLLISNYVDIYFNEYLRNIDSETSINILFNMLDLYVSEINEIDLNDKIFNEFTYYDYMDELIHSPLIRIYNFLCSKAYFNIAYKKMNKFYNKNKKIRNYKKEECIYPTTINTLLLNKDKKKMTVLGKNINYDLNDFINYVTNKLLNDIKAINEYLFEKQNDHFREIFNIDKDKKI